MLRIFLSVVQIWYLKMFPKCLHSQAVWCLVIIDWDFFLIAVRMHKIN